MKESWASDCGKESTSSDQFGISDCLKAAGILKRSPKAEAKMTCIK